MDDSQYELPARARIGWWLFVLLLAVVAAGIAYSFLGMLVLGIFGYYATRPINRRLSAVIDSDGIAAWLTVLLVLLPLILILFYAGFQLFQQAQQALSGSGFPYEGLLDALPEAQRQTLLSALENPQQFASNPQSLLSIAATAGSALSGGTLLLSLAITLTAFLLTNDDGLGAYLGELFGGRDTTAYAYATALDEDFASVFFGNFLFVLVMAVVSTIVYWLTNLLAPAGLQIPMFIVLGFLTGVASLIPAVVGKVIYIPVVAYLAVQAVTEGSSLAFVGGVFVVYFLVLDFLPQTFVQPLLTGRQLNTVMMMFGYLLGPILFGWYGLFLLPMIFIVMVEALRIVVPNLVHGESLTTDVVMGESVGTTPQEAVETVPDGENVSDGDDGTESDSASDADSA